MLKTFTVQTRCFLIKCPTQVPLLFKKADSMNNTKQKTMPLTRIQKLIGKLMTQSKQEKPCFYLEIHADVTDLLKMRKPYCRKAKIKASTNDFFLRAISNAAKQHPIMAGHLDESAENIVISEKVGVGFAVAASQGLVVPVIQDVTNKTLAEIAENSADLINKARSNKLHLDDFDGDNIVLSGLGMFGVASFLAIAPPSATSIVSIGKIDETIVPHNGVIGPRKLMSVALAVDNRIVDEVQASEFLRCVIDQIENPESLTD
jgi:pyruvate dehydrogenase E2 component (dihydrolipoamide acetyltransferase)